MNTAHIFDFPSQNSRSVLAARRKVSKDATDAVKVTNAGISEQIAALSLRQGGASEDSVTRLTADKHRGGLEYLQNRHSGGLAFAAAAGAHVGNRVERQLDGRFRSGGWEVRWPIRESGTGNLTGIMRENHEAGQHYLGVKQGGSLYVRPRAGASDTLVIGEGPWTVNAVWSAFNCHALIKFDAGNLETMAAETIKKMTVKTIWILADHDATVTADGKLNRRGQRACQRLAETIMLTRPDITVKIATPRHEGDDWDDVANKRGLSGEDFKAEFLNSLKDLERPAPVGPDDGAGQGADILSLNWTQASDPELALDAPAPGLSLKEGNNELQIVTTDAVNSLRPMRNRPVVIQATTGGGKTAAMAQAIAHARTAAPLLFVTPRVADAQDLAEKISAAGQHVHLHHGRSAQNCNKFGGVAEVVEKGRSPQAWECNKCEHGPIDAQSPCQYMMRMRESRYARVVIATHAAVAEESSLHNYARIIAGEEKGSEPRSIIVDEAISQVKPLDVKGADVEAVIATGSLAADQIESFLKRERDALDNAAGQEDRSAALKRIEDLLEAREWNFKIYEQLKFLNAKRLETLQSKELKAISGEDFEPLLKLLVKTGKKGGIPAEAQRHDGTILEDVALARKNRLEIPTSWLKTLGQAMDEGTAYFQAGKIVGGHTSKLWQKFGVEGGINLDATPSLKTAAEIAARSGEQHRVEIDAPLLQIHQYGPQLFGRGNLTDEIKKSHVARIIAAIKCREVGKVAVITHKPIALAVQDALPSHVDFIGWWGKDERAHNRWSCQPDRESGAPGVEELIIFGLNIQNPAEAQINYALDRAALQKVGVEWAAWDGSVERGAKIEVAGGMTVTSAAPLPTVADARDWLLDKIAADTAQAIGRLRAVRATKPVKVSIYGAVPLIGHGIKIHEFHRAPGRVETKAQTVAAIAEAVVTAFPARLPSQREMTAFVKMKLGITPSTSTVSKIFRSIKRAALASGVTMDEMAQRVRMTAEQPDYWWQVSLRPADFVRMARRAMDAATRTENLAIARVQLAVEDEKRRAWQATKRAGP